MRSRYRILRRGFIGIVIFIVVSIGAALGPRLYYLKSEDVTAAVIRAADRSVAEHPGKWPQSWQDLGSEDLSRYTDFRFDLTPELIVRDRQLIYGAIQPRCHQYRTYPHARAQLDGLYVRLTSTPSRPRRAADAAKPAAVGGCGAIHCGAWPGFTGQSEALPSCFTHSSKRLGQVS